jgi:protein arginine kinase
MDASLFANTDSWLAEPGPAPHLVVASRARFARNLAGFPFVPHAPAEVLERVDAFVAEAIGRSDVLSGYRRVELSRLSPTERCYLKECRLISKEMESAARHRTVYLAPDGTASIMVNEEDHLRVQALAGGLNIGAALARLEEVERELGHVVGFAFSSEYGFLTACPTNVGTGFRGSVMLHLPGLSMLQDVDSALQGIAHYGLTVRGFWGEHSDYIGDFYQISNEVTLGKSVEEIVRVLGTVIARLVEREEDARVTLCKNHSPSTHDAIWRSYALLCHARKMDSGEAMRLLSRLRLAIEWGMFKDMTHHELTRLVMEVLPSHLEARRELWTDSLSRDEVRAAYLRRRIGALGCPG